MSEKRIDYIVVIERKIKTSKKINHIVKYIKSLEGRGLQVQIKHGKRIKENVYLAIHLPSNVVESLANMYNVNIVNHGHTRISTPASKLSCKLFQTPLSRGADLFRRQAAGQATNAERIMIVEEVLQEAHFGDNENDFGLEKLLAFNLAKDAYPLHDDYYTGKSDPGQSVPENDRQLLLKYWANFSFWYKEHPINLIQKYYGSEVAFYFAWAGFYNTMLVPAAVVGTICSIGSVMEMFLVFQERVDDICTSNLMLCPLCSSGPHCQFRPLNLYCEYTKVSVIFDNVITVGFAVFMSFWATFFITLWTRLENTLKIQWNVEFDDIDTKTRTKYKDKCTYKKWSDISEKLEPYTPACQKFIYMTLSHGTCLLLAIIVIMLVFAVVLYRVQVNILIQSTGDENLETHSLFLLTLTSAFLQVIFIKIFGLFYTQLAEMLTHMENPRTQTEFDDSVVYKRYFLAISNNYAPLFYIAFLQGRLYSPSKPKSLTRFETDICHPTGCFMSLCTQLLVLMLFQSIIGNLLSLIMPKIGKKIVKKIEENEEQWEKEYKLIPTNRYLLVDDYSELIIQYGFVTFFVAAFPLAPLCALLSNTFELRLDAYKLLTRYRRPVPRQHSGIGAWNRLLIMITHLSVATNAFVLAFTSDFVNREIYKFGNNGSLDGYINSTLSIYDMTDYHGPVEGHLAFDPTSNSTYCYYQAMRYPPDHPNKYELTPNFWFHIGMKLLCVIAFEHIIMLMNGVLGYFIPDVPQVVKETLHYERTKMLELQSRVKPASSSNLEGRTTVNIKRWEK